ncbi:MAG: ribonuclease H-like domain-containing protein [Chloroflexota bacterium]
MSADLRERLRRVLGPSRPAQPDGQLRPATPAADEARARRRDVQDLVAGSVIEGPLGACFVAEHTLALDHRHGSEPLGRFFEVTDRSMGCLARSAEPLEIDRESIVFLDTETTGLAGGTGTYAFMVGLAYFRGERLLVRQYFMRHHAEEPAMLAALSQVLGQHEAIVTFNGKSFDVPLLLTRYTANRQPHAVPAAPHLDLLHPARRFWREQLEACNLGTLERAILGHHRGADVPGWMIPDLYFRYLRGGDPGLMAMVFEHNLHDLLSLVALVCRLGWLLDGPADVPPHAAPSVYELFGAARIYEDLGLWDEAFVRYEQALRTGRAIEVRARVAARLAALCKRAGRHERALQLWRRLASLGLTGCEPYIELAKHFEHRLRDYDAAVQVVEEALGALEIQALRRRPGVAAERAALEHRLARLHQKRRRARGASVSASA